MDEVLARIAPAAPRLVREPFSREGWIFELKYDGFRCLAVAERGQATLISRHGNTYKRYSHVREAIAALGCDAVIDGELVCFDQNGKPQFYDLMFRRREPVFVAFDLLSLAGVDWREKPLLERKARLRQLVQGTSLLYADHVEREGIDFFRLICSQDLEGIVAKRATGAYGQDWLKIKNPAYSQGGEKRHELFEPRRGR